jgi:hypothetical protein
MNALMEEAFANTVEQLASMEAQSLLHQSFFAWNSYSLPDADGRAVLEMADQRLGDEMTFYLLWFGHVIANLCPKEPPEDLAHGLLDRMGAPKTRTARNVVTMALNLNVAFRAETNPAYFQMQGLLVEYEMLCRLPVEAYLDLVDMLKPWASQLWEVLRRDGALPSQPLTTPNGSSAIFFAALQQQEQVFKETGSYAQADTSIPAKIAADRARWLATFQESPTSIKSASQIPSSAGAKYTIIRSLLQQPLLGRLYEHALARAKSGAMGTDDQVPQTPSAYADPVMEELLSRLLPAAEAAAGEALFATFSYLRVYKRGDILNRHKDRPAGEISITLNLGYDAASPWPISIQVRDEPTSVSLDAGDALFYHGTEVEHWRDRFEGACSAQVFLNYVRQRGPHAPWKFDKRQNLNCLSIPDI